MDIIAYHRVLAGVLSGTQCCIHNLYLYWGMGLYGQDSASIGMFTDICGMLSHNAVQSAVCEYTEAGCNCNRFIRHTNTIGEIIHLLSIDIKSSRHTVPRQSIYATRILL